MTNSYTIKPGDTLSAIAQRHGLRDWRLLYFTSANANFREQYPDPDTIRPGAQIRIPPNPEAQMRQLRTKLDELRRVRLQIIQFGEKGKSELTASTRQIKTFGSSVDAAATVATLVYSLGSLVGKGLQWNAATGMTQQKLRDDIVKDTMKGVAKKRRDAVAVVVSSAETGSSSTAWLAVKALAQAWCDITSPSFWANTVSQLLDPADPNSWKSLGTIDWATWSRSVRTKPEDVERKARADWDRFIQSSLRRIDEQIRELEAALR